jgi:hypothetical protein
MYVEGRGEGGRRDGGDGESREEGGGKKEGRGREDEPKIFF